MLFRPCSSCLFLSSTYYVYLAAFLIWLCITLFRTPVFFFLFRLYAGIFFPVFVLFRPCSSYLFLLSTYICCSCSLSDVLASQSSELMSAFFVYFSSYFPYFSWSGLFCCVLVPGTLAFHLPYLDELRLLCFFSVSFCDHRICISRTKNQHGHWVYCCRWVERTVHSSKWFVPKWDCGSKKLNEFRILRDHAEHCFVCFCWLF